MPPATLALLGANVAIFLLQGQMAPQLVLNFALWPPGIPGAPAFEPWQLVSYGFLHGGLTHLFFNMLGLWMFGSEVERVWGQRRYLQFYAASVLAAALMQREQDALPVLRDGLHHALDGDVLVIPARMRAALVLVGHGGEAVAPPFGKLTGRSLGRTLGR